MYVWSITAVNKAYKLFEDEEQVKYYETIVEEARSQLETKVNCYLNYSILVKGPLTSTLPLY